MSLASLESLSFSFGGKPLFTDIRFVVEDQDRIALIGPNGTGKSTLLSMVAGLREPDSGRVSTRRGLRIGYVQQKDLFPEGATVESVLAAATPNPISMEEERRVRRFIGEIGMPSLSAPVSSLSGGWRKRLAIAEGFVRCPDLLLLDEPTNHLDLDGIAWLESALESFPGGVVFVSHDRYLIERTATKVVELHRRYPKGFILLEGSYSDFIEQRVEYLAQLETQRSALANKVRREVAWLRRGPKAQRSKSQARIKQAGDMIEELKGFQQNSTDVRLEFNDTGKRTKELIKLDQLGISYGEKRLIEGLTLTLSPGMRLGIVGGNGCGKSSLLKLINGELAPTKGQLWRLPTIQIGYFDQYRASLDPKVTLHNSLAPDGSHVVFNGREIHVSSWVTRFGLRADQLATRVGDLSGGEQARLAVARMMVSQSHLLLLDEPTNDLDIGTLEALEDALVEFEGALVVVSHDRYLLDRISTRLLALRGDGRWEFCASFPQWEELRSQWQADNEAGPSRTPAAKASAPADAKAAFSYKHHRELSGIDGKIQAAEALLAELQTRTEQPLSHVELTELYETVAKTQEEIDSLYERWGELEKLKQESEK